MGEDDFARRRFEAAAAEHAGGLLSAGHNGGDGGDEAGDGEDIGEERCVLDEGAGGDGEEGGHRRNGGWGGLRNVSKNVESRGGEKEGDGEVDSCWVEGTVGVMFSWNCCHNSRRKNGEGEN